MLKGLFATTNHEDDKDGSGDHEKEHTLESIKGEDANVEIDAPPFKNRNLLHLANKQVFKWQI